MICELRFRIYDFKKVQELIAGSKWEGIKTEKIHHTKPQRSQRKAEKILDTNLLAKKTSQVGMS